MSAFLGPIHIKMYGRILYQDEMAQAILSLAEEKSWADGLRALADEKAPAASTAPLEEIIDQGNIHGWLNAAVALCERRFAIIAGGILHGHAERLEALQGLMKSFGRQCGLPVQRDAEQAFQAIHDILLDGMPCDFPFNVASSNAEAVTWVVEGCPHTPYWQAESYEPEMYYLLRDAWVEGALHGSGIVHTRAGGRHTLQKER